MVKTALLSVDLERGADVVKALDQAKVKVDVALWVVLPEYEDWRMVVSSRDFDSSGLKEGRRLLDDSLSEAGFTAYTTPTIMILPKADPFIRDLRRYFSKTKEAEGQRIGMQMLGGRFIEDGYVYRVS